MTSPNSLTVPPPPQSSPKCVLQVCESLSVLSVYLYHLFFNSTYQRCHTILFLGRVMCMLLYLKWITNKDLLYSTWNSAQCYVPAWWEEGLQGEMDTYIWMSGAFLVAQMVKNLPAMRETWVRSLSWENPLEEGTSTHSSILAWRNINNLRYTDDTTLKTESKRN